MFTAFEGKAFEAVYLGGIMMRFLIQCLVTLSFLAALAPTAHAKEATFTIRSGDILQVTVWKEEGMDREIVVLPDGTLTFPLAGSVKVSGLTPSQAEEAIKERLKGAMPDASVTVVVKAPLGHTVNVIGQVQKPGEIVIGGRMTVMQALSQAGGLTAFAKERGIIILRRINDEEISIPFPYGDVSSGDSLEKNIDLLPGDVIVVPTAGLF